MPQAPHQHRSTGNLKVAFFVNVLFVAVEVAGGLWTNSIAILTDALHDGADASSLGLAWYLEKLSAKRADAKFTYGYRRFSSLGALVTGLVLIVGLAVIMWNAIKRLQEPEEVIAPGMLGIAAVGILLNGVAAWKLSGGHSLNEKVASWHLFEDTLGWIAVLIGSVVMMTWRLPAIDPILAILISLYVLWNALRNLKKVALVFLQGAPRGFDADGFERTLTAIPGVVGAHHTHTWTLDGESHVFSTHLVMARGSEREKIIAAKRRVHALLRDKDFEHITVEVEIDGEMCAEAGAD